MYEVHHEVGNAGLSEVRNVACTRPTRTASKLRRSGRPREVAYDLHPVASHSCVWCLPHDQTELNLTEPNQSTRQSHASPTREPGVASTRSSAAMSSPACGRSLATIMSSTTGFIPSGTTRSQNFFPRRNNTFDEYTYAEGGQKGRRGGGKGEGERKGREDGKGQAGACTHARGARSAWSVGMRRPIKFRDTQR